MLTGKIFNRDFLHLLINEQDYKTGVEVGVQFGGYSKYLLDNTILFMYLVDIWKMVPGYHDISNVPDNIQEERLRLTIKNLLGMEDRYKIIRKFSIDAAKDFTDNSINFIYLDANHTFESVYEDLYAWYPKLTEGGLMSGHDFVDGDDLCGSNFGVKSAVLKFISENPNELFVTYDPADAWPTWYFIKK